MSEYYHFIDPEDNIIALYDLDFTERNKVFTTLIKAFAEKKISWCLMCSMSLFLRGLIDDFNDIDFLVDVKDFDKVEEIFNGLDAKLVNTEKTDMFRSDIYHHYVVDGVNVDVIAGFRVRSFGTEFHYELNPDSVETVELPYIGKLPMLSLEIMYILYAMMEGGQARRKYKRKLIERYLRESGVDKMIFARAASSSHLPKWIKDKIKSFS